MVRRGVGPRREGGLVDLRLAYPGDPGDSCGGGAVEGHGAEVPGRFIRSKSMLQINDPSMGRTLVYPYLMILSGLWVLLLTV